MEDISSFKLNYQATLLIIYISGKNNQIKMFDMVMKKIHLCTSL